MSFKSFKLCAYILNAFVALLLVFLLGKVSFWIMLRNFVLSFSPFSLSITATLPTYVAARNVKQTSCKLYWLRFTEYTTEKKCHDSLFGEREKENPEQFQYIQCMHLNNMNCKRKNILAPAANDIIQNGHSKAYGVQWWSDLWMCTRYSVYIYTLEYT